MAAGQLTLYGAQALLGGFFGQTVTPPANYYFALTTTLTPPNFNGSEIVEPPASSGYYRMPIPNTNVYFSIAANQPYVMNNTSLIWPVAASVIGATADWPVAIGWALADAQTAGNLYAVGTLATPVVVPNGYCASMQAGDFYIELSPFFQIATN
jgi:hypothetical protein